MADEASLAARVFPSRSPSPPLLPPRDALLEMLSSQESGPPALAALKPQFPGPMAYRGAPDLPLEAPDVPNPLEAFAGGGQASTIGRILRGVLRRNAGDVLRAMVQQGWLRAPSGGRWVEEESRGPGTVKVIGGPGPERQRGEKPTFGISLAKETEVPNVAYVDWLEQRGGVPLTDPQARRALAEEFQRYLAERGIKGISFDPTGSVSSTGRKASPQARTRLFEQLMGGPAQERPDWFSQYIPLRPEVIEAAQATQKAPLFRW
jgi:hypothetical protein